MKVQRMGYPLRARSSWRVPMAHLALAGSLALALPAAAAYDGPDPLGPPSGRDGGNGVFILEGEFVHNVGELQMNITNWGLIGSQPGRNTRFSDQPSGMWPAGSGVDYLWAAGLWVGALKNNVPLVSTGQFATEFLPNPDDPLDTIYSSFQGAVGGARYPDPAEDDDGDGQINEDPLNGLDDDGDGAIDEDFEALGSQYFRATQRDDTALAIENLPEHEPMNLSVVQESFQWENDSVDDFIGFQFTIRNEGVLRLQNVYLGFFADCDVGPRGQGGIAEDDLPGFFEGAVRALDNSFVPLSVAFMYDSDGDDGQSSGFFGVLFLNHPIDPTGASAPRSVGITSFQRFSGSATFEQEGDPQNDAERYELLSRVEKDVTPDWTQDNENKAADFRFLVATGPFVEMAPQDELFFQAAMVCGEGFGGLISNSAEAALTYYGAYFDRDGNPDTGKDGRETQLCAEDFPDDPKWFEKLWLSTCDTLGVSQSGQPLPAPLQEDDLDENLCVYVNADCVTFELPRRGRDGCDEESSGAPPEALVGCTGTGGREYFVPWLVGLAPQSPNLRVVPRDNRVHIFWNNLSQIIPDLRLQKSDFESYRIWRADGWDRPFGTSVDNGPASSLWSLIAEYDVVNFFEDRRVQGGVEITQRLPLGANTGLDLVSYVPEVYRTGTPAYENAAPVRDLVRRILEDPEFSFLGPTTDPSKFIRYLNEDGVESQVGAAFPQLRDFEDSYDVVDTVYFVETGVEFFEYVDRRVFNGIAYFYSVTATDFAADASGESLLPIGPGLIGDPQSNFGFATPKFAAQTAEERAANGHNIFVFPNPATRSALAEFSQLNPNADDPTGVRVMFANLPADRNTINIYTLAGDLVQTIEHDGTAGGLGNEGYADVAGSAFWNLVSRNGQEVVSGIYLYSVESQSDDFDRVIGRFVVIR